MLKPGKAQQSRLIDETRSTGAMFDEAELRYLFWAVNF